MFLCVLFYILLYTHVTAEVRLSWQLRKGIRDFSDCFIKGLDTYVLVERNTKSGLDISHFPTDGASKTVSQACGFGESFFLNHIESVLKNAINWTSGKWHFLDMSSPEKHEHISLIVLYYFNILLQFLWKKCRCKCFVRVKHKHC